MSQSELVREWGAWIDSLAKWDWFITLTFKPTVADTWSTASSSSHAHLAWLTLIDWLTRPSQPVRWIRALEPQKQRGVPHVHGLVAVPWGVTFSWLSRLLYESYGSNRWLKYDPSRGAAAYISKYVVKELGDITWSDNLGVRTNVLEAGLAPFLKPAPRLEEPPEPLRVDLLPNEIRWLEIANRPHSGAVGRLREVDPPRHV